jgi:predicted nucleic acid-binding protein
VGDVRVQGVRATTRAPEPPKAYLDNNLVGALAQGQFSEDELGAIYQLIDLSHAGRISLVTSPRTLDEISRVPEEHRAPHEAIYAFLKKVPTVDEDVLLTQTLSAAPGPKSPVVVQDADIHWLYSILKHRIDAQHVYYAVKSECAYFVTTDQKTILSRAGEIEDKFPIKLAEAFGACP